MSFISLSNFYARNLSITSDFHLQTYSSNLSFPINFCHRYFPLLDIKAWKLMKSNYCSFSNLAAFICSSQCFSFKLVSSQTFFLLTALTYFIGACELFLSKMTYKGFFFLIGLILCPFLEYKDILSFCLFLHSNYFFLAISGMSVLAFSDFSGCYFESSQGQLLLALALQLTGYGC